MRKDTYRIALCGVMAAVSVVLLGVGAMLGIGCYAGPMLAGLCLLPVGRQAGRKYHALLWLAVSLLSFLLISDVEQNLMYLCLFGLYPLLRPGFEKLPGLARPALKLLFFNAVIIALEALVMLVLVPEAMPGWMIALLLVLGNLTFLMYDFLIPRYDALLWRKLQAFLSRVGR